LKSRPRRSRGHASLLGNVFANILYAIGNLTIPPTLVLAGGMIE